MIEKMIAKSKIFFPLRVSKANWSTHTLLSHLYGDNWNFNSFSSWRISSNQMICRCFDHNSTKIFKSLKGQQIIDIQTQDNFLKIDPVFIFSNGLRLEIFSTDTYEPWTFNINNLGLFIASPSEPQKFDPSD